MISKETFVDVMNRLEVLDEKMDNVDVALKELSSDFNGLYIPQVFDIVLDILSDVFEDKNNWISYFVFDLDLLHSYDHDSVTVGDEPIDLSTWDKVYDFLIGNMNNN